MFNLPGICQLYNTSIALSQLSKNVIDYNAKKAQAQSQSDFDENKFQKEYCKNNNISPDFLNSVESNSEAYFSSCSQGLGGYELANISSSLTDYASSQKKIKKIINYFDLNLESLLSADSQTFGKTKAKVQELNADAGEALKEYIKRFKGVYDNLTINDFKGKNVDDELAMQRYANYIASTFSSSSQSIEENKNSALKLKKKFKLINRKLENFEQKKLKINAETSKGLYSSNYSIAQVDDILGIGYVNKKRWKDNLAIPLRNGLQSLISASK